VEGIEGRLRDDQSAAQAASRSPSALVLLAVTAVDQVLGQQQLACDGEAFQVDPRRMLQDPGPAPSVGLGNRTFG